MPAAVVFNSVGCFFQATDGRTNHQIIGCIEWLTDTFYIIFTNSLSLNIMKKKIEKYTGDKTYMFPNGEIATKEAVLKQFPAALTFVHYVETDENGEVMWAFQNLSAMRTMYEIDSSLSEEEALAKIEEIINTPPAEPAPDANERIAAALEYQNLMAMTDVQ